MGALIDWILQYLGENYPDLEGRKNRMNWLKKIGQVVLKGVGIASESLPFLSFLTPLLPAKAQAVEQKVISEFSAVKAIVGTVEQVSVSMNGPDAKTGPAKLAAAVPFVSTLFLESEAMVGHKVKDEAAFTAAISKITSGFADAWNAVE